MLFMSRVFPRSRRLLSFAAAALLLVTSVVQTGCGVLHCVDRDDIVEANPLPPCHGGESAKGGEAGTSHHGDDEGSCCVAMPLEAPRVQALASSPILEMTLVVFGAAPFEATPKETHRSVETGPPRSDRLTVPVPLRV